MIYDIDGNLVSASEFVSVKDYGAKGDGVTDDASSIQSALDDVTSGIIFFPAGVYLVKSSVLFKSNQTLWFENGASLLQGAAINNLLMSYCADNTTGYNGTHDCLIYGATFDGGAYTQNNTLVGTVHCKNITFENCTFKNAYGTWHDLEINSTYNAKVLNCDFEGARKTSADACLIQIDAIDNTSTWPWDNRGSVDSTVSKYVEIAGNIFHDDTMSPAIGNHSSTEDAYLRIHDNVFDGFTSTRGAIKFQSANNVDIYSNTFLNCTTGIASGNNTYYIHDNRFVGATTAISATGSVAHANMINGTYTA